MPKGSSDVISDQFADAERRYNKLVERRARGENISPLKRKENTTTLYEAGSERLSPSILAIQREMLAARARVAIEDKTVNLLPPEDAICEIIVREPRGEFRCRIEIPRVGEAFSSDQRHQRGYQQLFVKGLLYALYGELR